MVSSILGYAGALALLSLASAQSTTSYTANTNTACGTTSDVDYQKSYYYSSDDTMDWGVYTQSIGTCDAGTYARVHMVDPSGNDVDCGYVALDGKLNLVSCSNYPRGYMQEGQYTLYWETVPGAGQYSWNQFSVTHTQATVTGPVSTQSVTTTPIQVITSTVTNTPTDTYYQPQATVTSPSATQVNTIVVTLPVVTTTTTTTSWYSITYRAYAQTTTTAYSTAACTRAPITKDYTGTRKTTTSNTNTTPKSGPAKVSRQGLADLLARLGFLRRRDGDQPNTVGIIGQPLTSTVTPDAVITTITAATATTTLTSTTNAPGVTVTVANPTPTVTVYSGIAVQTITTTPPASTKSIIKSKLSVTWITTTSTLTYTKKIVTTPLCAPTGQ